MKTHTLIGAKILAEKLGPVLTLGREIALTHHERWDGSGYPRGLKGEAIPISGRIVSVVAVFDALSHARPYKPSVALDETLAEITANRGGQFDPEVVDAFLSLVSRGRLPVLGGRPEPARA